MNIDKSLKENLKKLGKHIKKLRKDKNITISELSKLTGIRKEYLLKIEEGTAYGVLINKHILKIANALKVNLSTIFNY